MRRLSRRWLLDVGQALPGARTAFVAPCRMLDGSEAVLRIAFPEPAAGAEAAALRAWGGRGSVRLLAADLEEDALLVERCLPGTPLGSVLGADGVLIVASSLLARLWRHDVAGDGLPHLAELARTRAAEIEQRLDGPLGELDPKVAADGLTLWRELSMQTDEVLLHADLHPRNVLAAAREPWLVIDPKPLVGDPAYEPIPLVLEAGAAPSPLLEPAAYRAELARRVRLVSRRLGLDEARVAGWGVARSVDWALFLSSRGDDRAARRAAAEAHAFAAIA